MKRAHIAILANIQIPFDRMLVRGIVQYARLAGCWQIYFNAQKPDELPEPANWSIDGVIARFHSPAICDAVTAANVPMIAVGDRHNPPGAPVIAPMRKVLVGLVVEYFFSRGYRRFAYCGEAGISLLTERGRAFAAEAGRRGCSCNIYTGRTREERSRYWGQEMAEMAAWLSSLQTPFAVLAANDERASHVLQACRVAGLDVPEQVAVMGVDNDEDICLSSTPALSSVDLAIEQIGYRAGEMLAQWLTEGTPPPSCTIPPRGVVPRASTDALAVEHPALAAALQMIHQNAHRPITIDDLLSEVPVSRRTLELLFREHVGRSPRDEIEMAHLRRAKMLLSETNWPLKKVAVECGFDSAQRLCRVFRRVLDQTPMQYRGGQNLM